MHLTVCVARGAYMRLINFIAFGQLVCAKHTQTSKVKPAHIYVHCAIYCILFASSHKRARIRTEQQVACLPYANSSGVAHTQRVVRYICVIIYRRTGLFICANTSRGAAAQRTHARTRSNTSRTHAIAGAKANTNNNTRMEKNTKLRNHSRTTIYKSRFRKRIENIL